MLIDQNVKVDECYTAVWRESKYTLIHCTKADRITFQALKLAMDSLQKLHGISLNATILSYEALSSNDSHTGESLEIHPGFKRIVHLLNTHSEDLKWWIAGGSNIHNHRKGMLWKYIETTDPMEMTHGQLVAKVNSWKPIVEECENMKSMLEVLNPMLQAKEEEAKQFKEALKQERMITKRLEEELMKTSSERYKLRGLLKRNGIDPDADGSE
jgi:hypothetical protein